MSLKRTVDILGAATGLVITSPLILAGAALMTAVNGSSPIFIQHRVGLNGREFPLLKIKTMRELYDDNGVLLPQDARTTKMGRVLRRLKIDELPQLINIIKGDMSFVGPRPRPSSQSISNDAFRQSVRPGLTGLAQVRGGNAICLDETLAYDQAYILKTQKLGPLRTLFYDASLAIQTPLAIFTQLGHPHYRADLMATGEENDSADHPVRNLL